MLMTGNLREAVLGKEPELRTVVVTDPSRADIEDAQALGGFGSRQL